MLKFHPSTNYLKDLAKLKNLFTSKIGNNKGKIIISCKQIRNLNFVCELYMSCLAKMQKLGLVIDYLIAYCRYLKQHRFTFTNNSIILIGYCKLCTKTTLPINTSQCMYVQYMLLLLIHVYTERYRVLPSQKIIIRFSVLY